jgi:hypothetical protein
MKLVSTAFYHQAQIDHILANFDFDKVAKTMEVLNWTWRDDSCPPTKERLREYAHDLLLNAMSEKSTYVSCGGFEVEIVDGVYLLRFVVADWDCGDMLTEEEEFLAKENRCRPVK